MENAIRYAYKYERNATAILHYDKLSGHAVIQLLAMDALLAFRLASGTLDIGDCDDLYPWDAMQLKQCLNRDRGLLDDPDATMSVTYYIKNF